MKTLPLSLLLIVGLTTGFSPQQPNDQIKKYRIKRVTSMAGISTKQKFVSDYDQRGNLIRKVGYRANGTQFLEETYKYDDKDNVIEAVVDGKKQTYVYRSDGQMLEARQFESGQLKAKHLSRRDAGDNVIEYSKYGVDGNLLERRLHTYKGKNVVMQTLVYGAGGNLASRVNYEYDGDRLSRQSTFGASGNLLRRNNYKRDQKGVVVEDLQTNERGEVVDRTTSEYEFYP